MPRPFYDQHKHEPELAAAVSALLVPQSYVSLDYVLQSHHVLTDVTYPVTCITPRNTRTITNLFGTFWYRNLRADLCNGYEPLDFWGIRYARATLAKALFDFLYLRPIAPAFRSNKFSLAEELRLNLDGLAAADWFEFAGYVDVSQSPKMRAVLRNLQKTL